METNIYTVSQLNLESRQILEDNFQTLWIVGEISNLARPSSGHLYFSLKDKRAQVRCALFRMNSRSLKFSPENGQEVLLQARVSLYEPRGDYQLIVSNMELAGDGALQLAFNRLKERLDKEGLFDPDHKKTIPSLPQQIGVITSASGAAIRDILKVLKRRFPSIPVIIYPTLVQGDKAAETISAAIKMANSRAECDVLLLSRGGGSLEDLWSFNEEIVARAIFASNIPIVTGIGHEVDFTIADFVADQRAATPSAAAELVSPDQAQWLQKISTSEQKLKAVMASKLQHASMQLEHLRKRLRHPSQQLQAQAQQLDQLEQRLITSMRHRLQQAKQRLEYLSHGLNTVSPLKTLERGYAIVTRDRDGKLVKNKDDVSVEDTLTIKLAKGELSCSINKHV